MSIIKTYEDNAEWLLGIDQESEKQFIDHLLIKSNENCQGPVFEKNAFFSHGYFRLTGFSKITIIFFFGCGI